MNIRNKYMKKILIIGYGDIGMRLAMMCPKYQFIGVSRRRPRHLNNVEFIEQPLHSNQDNKMDNLPKEIRKICAADESLHSPKDAERLACEPNKFGIYNIKLMKCGGINPSLKIASAAYAAGIAKIRVMITVPTETMVLVKIYLPKL